jgi:hypothetical protein
MRGRVIAKSLRTLVFDVTFRVQASGRDRARREGHRNVHAFARGRWLAEADLAAVLGHPGAVRIRYDPLLFDTFVRADTLEPVHHARMLAIDGTVAWAVRA